MTELRSSWPPLAVHNTSLSSTTLDINSTSYGRDLEKLAREYLLEGVQRPPTSGFGKVPVFYHDLIKLDGWDQDGDGLSVPIQRAIHCIICTEPDSMIQDNDSGWEVCANYTENVSNSTYSNTIDMSATSSVQPFEFRGLDFIDSASAFLCAFGISHTNPYNISVAFPALRRSRGATHLFSESNPTGAVYVTEPREIKPTSPKQETIHNSIGIKVGVALGCLIALGIVFWLVRKTIKNKRRERQKTLAKQNPEEGDAPPPVYSAEQPVRAAFVSERLPRAEGEVGPPARAETMPPSYDNTVSTEDRADGARAVSSSQEGTAGPPALSNAPGHGS